MDGDAPIANREMAFTEVRSRGVIFLFRLGSEMDPETISQGSVDPFTMELRETLHALKEFLSASKQKMAEDEEEEVAKEDWHFAAMVLDRFCLYFFTIVCGVFIMIVFL